MRGPTKTLLTGTICLLAALPAVGAAATPTTSTSPTPSPTPTPTPTGDLRVIAAGVSAGGVDLGGLTVAAATQQLAQRLTPALSRTVVVGVAGKVFRFSPSTAKLSLDAHTTAIRAYKAGVKAAGAPASVALAIDQQRSAIQSFVAGLAQKVYVPAHDASMQITLTHLQVHRSSTGHKVNETGLFKELQATLEDPTAERVLHVKLQITHPALNANAIERQDYTVVTVDRKHFKLRLFKNRKLVKTYGVAVGRSGLETPTGSYHVLEREVNPPWHVPNSSWAGSLAGTTVPPGPGDPIVARWMGLGGGIGIHGTDEPFSIGSAASHGCIRMRPADVIALYPRVPLGTTVYIK